MSDRDNPMNPSGDPADDGTQPYSADDATSTPAEHGDATGTPADGAEPAASAADEPAAYAADESAAADEPAAGDEVAATDEAAASDEPAADSQTTDDSREVEGVRREPSKYELDAKSAEREAAAGPAYPGGADDEVEGPKKLAPSKWAQIFLGALAALLIGFGILSLSQDATELHRSIMPQQVAVVSQYLAEDDGPKLSDEQLKSAQEAWQENGDVDDPSGDNLATVINEASGAGTDEQVTAEQIDKVIEDNKLNLTWSQDEVQSMLTRQAAMFLIGGAIAAVALIFYRQAKAWARVVGMFISGLAGIMFLMQVVQGGMNVFSLLLTIAGIGAFYFLIKGRLQEVPLRTPGFGGGGGGAGGFGGLGGLFKPRRPNDSA